LWANRSGSKTRRRGVARSDRAKPSILKLVWQEGIRKKS
jgi:hypothetical protein